MTDSTPAQEGFIASALRTIDIETDAIRALKTRIDHDFVAACELLLACTGRVIVIGMGKSGHIARKIAATLASTGTPAFFVHPAEASHGDLGMITAGDVVLALSNSGSTSEVVSILPLIKMMGVPLISMTGSEQSAMAQAANVHLNSGVTQEACPLGLAPTSSTTTALVLGDALAVALLEARGFTADDFAFSHPGGALGRRLLVKVADVMRSGHAIPQVALGTPLRETLLEISSKGLGMTAVVDSDHNVVGVYTDGDLRRSLDRGVDVHHALVDSEMTTNYKHGHPNMLAAEALGLMESHKITGLLIKDESKRLVGVLHMHDLLQAGIL